ncbi:MAG TPA: hypothetical protein VN426_01870 [Syntrophomonadaceae bacterium]|nr:hypothetical protein [Syntrophomonadaceae bacterium]
MQESISPPPPNNIGHGSIAITIDLYSNVLEYMQKDAADKVNLGIFG